jgi:hypothetical protein
MTQHQPLLCLCVIVTNCRQDVDVGIAKFLTQESIELNKREELRVLVEGVDALEAQVLLWAEEEAKQNKLVALLSAQREIKVHLYSC